MSVQALICICIHLSWGLIEPNPQGEITLQELAQGMKSLEHMMQNLTSVIMDMEKKQDMVVSFKAYMSQAQTVTVGSTLVFDHAESNVGNGYNPTSGVFRAPISGIYIFSAIVDAMDPGTTDYALVKQGVTEMYMTVKDSWDSRSMTSTMHVAQGDDVFVTKTIDHGNNPRLQGGMWTQFSGHLLRVD